MHNYYTAHNLYFKPGSPIKNFQPLRVYYLHPQRTFLEVSGLLPFIHFNVHEYFKNGTGYFTLVICSVQAKPCCGLVCIGCANLLHLKYILQLDQLIVQGSQITKTRAALGYNTNRRGQKLVTKLFWFSTLCRRVGYTTFDMCAKWGFSRHLYRRSILLHTINLLVLTLNYSSEGAQSSSTRTEMIYM